MPFLIKPYPDAFLRAERITSHQAISSGSGVDVVFNSVIREHDPLDRISYSTSTGVITFNTTGWYGLVSTVLWAADSTNRRILTVQHSADGEVVGTEIVPGASSMRHQISALIPADEGETATVEAFQNTGGDLNIEFGVWTNMTVAFLGPE